MYPFLNPSQSFSQCKYVRGGSLKDESACEGRTKNSITNLGYGSSHQTPQKGPAGEKAAARCQAANVTAG